jgi:4-alpha-glucanotransferase
MAAEGHAWWIARVRRALEHCDLFRIDHFRGFAAYWEVPASAPTAASGRWVPGPGLALFEAIAQALGPVPIVAEDLGVITPDVTALRDACGFPGMRVLQFAFGDDATNPYLPHHHVPAAVVYTGTHDNETSVGWWAHANPHERAFAGSYLAPGPDDIHWAMIRAACHSVARTAIFPLQDVLGLPSADRMNAPGTPTGNWAWRFDWGMVGAEPGRVLGVIAASSGRAPFELLAVPGVRQPAKPTVAAGFAPT